MPFPSVFGVKIQIKLDCVISVGFDTQRERESLLRKASPLTLTLLKLIRDELQPYDVAF